MSTEWTRTIRAGDRLQQRAMSGKPYGPVRTVREVHDEDGCLRVVFKEEDTRPFGFYAIDPLKGWVEL